MDLRLATLKAVSFYLLHDVSTLYQFRGVSYVIFVYVNNLSATKVTLISHECTSVISLWNVLCSSVLHLVNGIFGSGS